MASGRRSGERGAAEPSILRDDDDASDGSSGSRRGRHGSRGQAGLIPSFMQLSGEQDAHGRRSRSRSNFALALARSHLSRASLQAVQLLVDDELWIELVNFAQSPHSLWDDPRAPKASVVALLGAAHSQRLDGGARNTKGLQEPHSAGAGTRGGRRGAAMPQCAHGAEPVGPGDDRGAQGDPPGPWPPSGGKFDRKVENVIEVLPRSLVKIGDSYTLSMCLEGLATLFGQFRTFHFRLNGFDHHEM